MGPNGLQCSPTAITVLPTRKVHLLSPLTPSVDLLKYIRTLFPLSMGLPGLSASLPSPSLLKHFPGGPMMLGMQDPYPAPHMPGQAAAPPEATSC